MVLTPSGQRLTLTAPEGPGVLELEQQGFYEVRNSGASERRPFTVAADIDPNESDLSPLDSREFVAAVMGRVGPEAAGTGVAPQVSPQEVERRQAIWWYLLFGGLLILAAETILSNRISKGVS